MPLQQRLQQQQRQVEQQLQQVQQQQVEMQQQQLEQEIYKLLLELGLQIQPKEEDKVLQRIVLVQ